jgi:putative ABC transport system ATP-binding protein
MKVIQELSRERSLFFVLPNDRQAEGFDVLMRFRGGQVTTERGGREAPADNKQLAGGVA